MRGTQARIYLSNLAYNINQIKKHIGHTKLCVSVKANAYGHGDTLIARKALECGADCLSVASVDEGRSLREAGIDAPVLLFGLTIPEEIPDIVRYRLTPFVCDIECIDLLDAAAGIYGFGKKECNPAQKKRNSAAKSKSAADMRGYPVHLKIDTGMGRIGCRSEKAAAIAEAVCKSKHLYLQGICTHFSVSDSADEADIEFTGRQIRLFNESVDAIKKIGIDPGIRHCSASGGILLYPQAHFDMVRAGIITYGYFPSSHCEKSKVLRLKPVMELTAPVVAVKTVEKGEAVSYGRCWTASEKTHIATLAIGYGDGLFRNLSPGLRVSICGKSYPLVGRICMDQCMVDIGNDENVHRWDEACIFGPEKNCPKAGDLADIMHTIQYEILTGISARVPRIGIP